MGWFFTGDVDASTPIYVTRHTATGETGSLSLGIRAQLIVLLLVVLNLLVWGLIGLAAAVIVVVGWLT